MSLLPLTPGMISGMFGRGNTIADRFFKSTRPKVRFLLVGSVALIALLTLAATGRVLFSDQGIQPAFAILARPDRHVGRLGLALLQDPAGIVVVVMALLTPFFCSQQVAAIADFVPMNVRNLGALTLSPSTEAQVNAQVAVANRWFSRLGTRRASVLLFVSAGSGSFLLYQLLETHGLLASWNWTPLPMTQWRHQVYEGWWANWQYHPVLAFALWSLGTFTFYFLAKQLAMGAIFAVFAHHAANLGFGVTPNLEFNTDGHQGLRTLRKFMLWTYGSSLAHFAGMLAVFIVWLPITQWTFFAAMAVMVTNAMVVVYPSAIAHNSALFAKTRYVEHLQANTTLNDTQKSEAIEKVWTVPALPFKTRSTLTAVTLYFLVPLMLAIVSALLKS